jgi:hypothetical protein
VTAEGCHLERVLRQRDVVSRAPTFKTYGHRVVVDVVCHDLSDTPIVYLIFSINEIVQVEERGVAKQVEVFASFHTIG